MNRKISKYVQQTMDAIGDNVLTKSTLTGNYFDQNRNEFDGTHVDVLLELGYFVKEFDANKFVFLFRRKQ